MSTCPLIIPPDDTMAYQPNLTHFLDGWRREVVKKNYIVIADMSTNFICADFCGFKAFKKKNTYLQTTICGQGSTPLPLGGHVIVHKLYVLNAFP